MLREIGSTIIGTVSRQRLVRLFGKIRVRKRCGPGFRSGPDPVVHEVAAIKGMSVNVLDSRNIL